jgi:hypothetical protein
MQARLRQEAQAKAWLLIEKGGHVSYEMKTVSAQGALQLRDALKLLLSDMWRTRQQYLQPHLAFMPKAS